MRLQVEHRTIYRYHQKVRFGRHRLVVRPREGHDLRIERMALAIEPAHHLVWVRDVFGNSIALVDFLDASDTLSIVNDVVVERLLPFPARHLHEPWQVPFPPVYDPLEGGVPAAYQAASFPEATQRLRDWLGPSLTPDPNDAEGTMLALCRLVHRSIAYRRRYDKGVQTPVQTLELGTGTCRDMATLTMDAARALGVAARFASGYLHGTSSMAGAAATHAWAEAYLPTLGWRGFDPTLGAETSLRHIVTGVSTHPRGVMPVAGSFVGTAQDYWSLEAVVKTTELTPALDVETPQPPQPALDPA
jgi:transglutaminase-like putative cysteine protease